MTVSFRSMCHLERGDMPVWAVKILGSIETLSREISCRNAAVLL